MQEREQEQQPSVQEREQEQRPSVQERARERERAQARVSFPPIALSYSQFARPVRPTFYAQAS